MECDKVVVGDGYILEPATLDRYIGEEASISLKSGSQAFNIQSDGKGQLEVVPLAGNDHFWGADFMLAYSFPSDCKSITWDMY